MKCDRASCFLMDEQKGQLWSKVAKGVSGVIRISAKKGIVGYVATSKQILNVKNAYNDTRFNPEFDIRTNYKTNTILCIPIMQGKQCLGVIQLINKLDGYFTKEDEQFGLILADISKACLLRAQ